MSLGDALYQSYKNYPDISQKKFKFDQKNALNYNIRENYIKKNFLHISVFETFNTHPYIT